jgi:oligopeptidase B
MTRLFLFPVVGALAFTGCATALPQPLDHGLLMHTSRLHQPPVARIAPHAMTSHEHERIDNYYWLRDDERKKTEVLAYLNEENQYTTSLTEPIAPLKDSLFEELKGRLKQDDASVPYELEGYFYYTRFDEGKEYPIFCRKEGSLEADEEVILDANKEALSHEYYHVAAVSMSAKHDIMAYAEDTLSRRIYTLRLKNLETGETLPDEVTGTSANMTWAMDNQTLFYVRRDPETLRAYQVYRHRLGSDATDDVLVFEEKDDTFYVTVERTKSKAYLVISSHSTLVTESRVLDATQPEGEFKVFLPRESNHEYSIDHAGDSFYIRTNWQAKNFRLMAATLGESQDKASWREVIAARSTVFLHGFEVFRDFLVLNERENVLRGLRILPWKHPEQGYHLGFGEPVYTATVGVNPNFDSRVLRYNYTSLTTPASVFDYDMSTKTTTLKKQEEVLGGFDAADYVAERLEATATDGTKVAMSIVHRRDLDRSQPQPTYLYAYGSYGYSMDPSFSSARLTLLDRGFIYAIAHIRGGQERGRGWYEDGKLLKKKNTFTDFVDCARHLVKSGYTSADKLVASGGSAGGLLVGAVANMAPEQFHAIIAHVPFVDVLTTMLDESIPLTTFEYDEWGNPNEKAYYDYMLSYSPYDQVQAQSYPHMFVFAGLHDSQVQYWEPAKWVAKLRALKTDDRILILHTNMEAGHGGASGRFERYRELAMEYAFLLDLFQHPDARGATATKTLTQPAVQ